MNLNSNISLKSLTQSGKNSKTPDKVTINLMQISQEKEKQNTRFLVWALAFVVLLALVFYGVYTPWQQMQEAEANAVAAEDRWLFLQLSNADYKKVEKQYNLYFGPVLTGDEASLLDRAEILDLLERVVMPAAEITRLDLPESNSFSVRLSGISLDGMHDLILALNEEPLVAMAGAPSLSTSEEQGTSEDVEFDLYITVVDSEFADNGEAEG